MDDLRHQSMRVIETRSGQRQIVQVRQVAPSVPGWRAYSVTALGPNREDGPLRLTVYDRISDLPDGPLAA